MFETFVKLEKQILVLKSLVKPKDLEIDADVEVEGKVSEHETLDKDSEKEYCIIKDILHEWGVLKNVRDNDANQFDKVSAELRKAKGHGW